MKRQIHTNSRAGGTKGATGPPEFPRLNKVELSQGARDDQGLIVLAPPDFYCLLPALLSRFGMKWMD